MPKRLDRPGPRFPHARNDREREVGATCPLRGGPAAPVSRPSLPHPRTTRHVTSRVRSRAHCCFRSRKVRSSNPGSVAGPATMQEPGLSAAEFRFYPLVSTHPASTPASMCPSSARRRCGRAAPEMLSQVREQSFVDSRALCVRPGAAISWSARWWLLLWPSRRAPTTAASSCDSSRPRAARAPARSPERERNVLAYRARILRPAITWPLPLCG